MAYPAFRNRNGEQGFLIPSLLGIETGRGEDLVEDRRGEVGGRHDVREAEEFAPFEPLFQPGVGLFRVSVETRMVLVV